MPKVTFLPTAITRRLIPLYVAAFFQGFVLWYAIEKLFMTSIGFTPATIGLMAAFYAVLTLLIETPSGILADRWSRKGVLILASIALAISSLICGLSTSVGMFIIGAGVWGISYALYSGTYDSIVYDTLIEETGHSTDYETYYGRIRLMDSLGLVLGALLGGVVSAALGLQASFFWAIPTILLSIVALWIFREPKLHKAATADPLLEHIKTTFKAVIHHPSLLAIGVMLVVGGATAELLMEFYQLWLIATSTPTVLYGSAAALIFGTLGAAGLLAPRLKLHNRAFTVVFIAVMLTAALTLTTVHSTWPVIVALTITAISLFSINIIYLRDLHDHLPSTIRSGASSAVSTASRAVFMIGALGFGWVAQHSGVFNAGFIILLSFAVISLFLYRASTAPELA